MRPVHCLLTTLLAAGIVLQAAAPNPQVPYQGRLLLSGSPVNGTNTFTFAILDASNNSLWTSGSLSLSVSNGIYSVVLGATGQPAIPTTVLDQAGLKLRVTVAGQALTPDVDLVPALQARSAFEVSGTFAGDVSGTQGATSVDKLKGVSVSATTPTNGQVLTYSGGQWAAATPSGDVSNLNASNLTSGTVPDGRFPATLPAASGFNLTSLNASNLGSGTVPDGRFPATLPAASGVNLTSLNASNLGSGTIPDARFPATLPAVSGANITSLSASSLSSGTVDPARLPALGGDLSSSAGSNSVSVVKLQGVTVSSTTPSTNQVLAYNGSNWIPTTISAGGSGTVTSVAAGTGLTAGGLGTTGGTITTSGTLSLADSGATANSYTNANITVDRYGRVTAAASGSSSPSTVFETVLLTTNATVTASAGTTHLLLNNQSGAPTGVTVQLPASPTNGQVISLIHYNASAVQAYTIDGNGKYVIASTNGATSSTYSATSANTRPMLVYCSSLNAWLILTLS